MKVQATAKFVGTSSRKLGLVASLIRGQKATTATDTLKFSGKGAAGPLGKVLVSAISNAQNNHNLKKADLIVESVLIGPGPTLKRFRPRARGSAGSIRKRMSHITVVLTDSASVKPEAKNTKEVTKNTEVQKPKTAENKKKTVKETA